MPDLLQASLLDEPSQAIWRGDSSTENGNGLTLDQNPVQRGSDRRPPTSPAELNRITRRHFMGRTFSAAGQSERRDSWSHPIDLNFLVRCPHDAMSRRDAPEAVARVRRHEAGGRTLRGTSSQGCASKKALRQVPPRPRICSRCQKGSPRAEPPPDRRRNPG